MGKASAPSPGRVERLQQQGAIEDGPFVIEDDETEAPPPHLLEMVIGGRTLVLDFDELGPADDTFARGHIGVPVSAFQGLNALTMGADVVLMMWCLARRKAGEPGLTYDRVVREFPTFKALGAAMDTSDPENPPIGWLTETGERALPE